MSDYSHLNGHRFPGGATTLGKHVAWLWADAAMTAPDPDVAHPSLGYVLAVRGGVSIEQLFALLDTSPEAGVVFGECTLDFERSLTPGRDYSLEGEIVSVERKSGRRSGPFDRLTFQVRIIDADDGGTVCTNTNTWIIPRPEQEPGI